jgi:hypothetical protein
MTYPVIEDIFEDVVQNVSDTLGQKIYFHAGHILETVNVVTAMKDSNTDHRYPLIALVEDNRRTTEGTKFTARLFIITKSNPNYHTKDRRENIFKPILQPIFDELIRQIYRCGWFLEQTESEVNENMEYANRFCWGNKGLMGNEGNIFNDWVDAIEIKSIELTALNTCLSSSRFNPITADNAFVLGDTVMVDGGGEGNV